MLTALFIIKCAMWGIGITPAALSVIALKRLAEDE